MLWKRGNRWDDARELDADNEPNGMMGRMGRNTDFELKENKEVNEMNMNLDEAVWYLRRFRDWHSGSDCRTLKDAGLSPRETGMAMDVILAHHGRAKPIRVCERCKYYDGMFGYCHKVTEGGRCDRDER